MSFKRAAAAFTLALAYCFCPASVSAQRDDAPSSIPAGTVIRVQMKTHLNSRSSYPGEKFTAISTDPVYRGADIILPARVEILGHVTTIEPAGRASRSGTLGVTFDSLRLPDGTRVAIDAELSSFDTNPRRELDDEGRVKGKGTGGRTAVFIGGAAGTGALIGLRHGGGKGAAIGSASGAMVGIIVALAMKGNEADVRPGTVFGVRLLREVRIETKARNYDPPSGRVIAASAMIRAAQQALVDCGYDPGPVDGVMSEQTSDALREFQHDNHLRESGVLDDETALALKLDESEISAPSHDRSPNPSPDHSANSSPNRSNASGTLARVLTANARREENGSISVTIAAEPPLRGERITSDYEVRGEKLEVSIRTFQDESANEPPSDGHVELVVSEGAALVDSVVVHGSTGDLLLGVGRFDLQIADRVESQANKMLEEYRKQLGITDKDGITVFNSNQTFQEDEVKLLFQFENFANAARLYARLNHSVHSSAGVRGAASSLLTQYRAVESQIGSVKVNDAIAASYKSIRSDLVAIAAGYRINF